MGEKEGSQLTVQTYVNLSIIILLLLVLMIFIVNLAYFTRENSDQAHIDLRQSTNVHAVIERESREEYFFTLLAEKESKVEGSLKKAKMPYTLTQLLEDSKRQKGNLIIDSSLLNDPEAFKVIERSIRDEKTIIFSNMPKAEDIKKYNLEEILGIAKIKREKEYNQLNLVPGFMLGGFHEFRNMRYRGYEIDLLFSTKVYGFANDNAPIIWRNTYKGSQVYVINGPFMDTNASYGMLTALMGEVFENYIYPVVNTRLITYEGFPYISQENEQQFEEIYSRDAMKVQNDILLPEILTLNRRREFIPNGYLRVGFGQQYTQTLEGYYRDQLNNAQGQFLKEGGQIGMWYSGDLGYDEKMYKSIFPGGEIESILVRKQLDDIDNLLEVSEELHSILGPWKEIEPFEYLNEDTVYIPFTVDGVLKTGQEKLEFISAVTAFASIVQNLNLEDVVLLKDNKENWQSLSRNYIKFTDDYRERFNFLEDSDLSTAAGAVKVFRNTTPTIKEDSDKISIKSDHWYGKSYYILKTNKEISGIRNGKIEEIEPGAYLVTVEDKELEIDIREYKNKTLGR